MIHENDPNKVLYENDKDQNNERELAQYVSRSWGVEIVKQKKNAQFDYILKKSNGSLAFAELRLRSCPMKRDNGKNREKKHGEKRAFSQSLKRAFIGNGRSSSILQLFPHWLLERESFFHLPVQLQAREPVNQLR